MWADPDQSRVGPLCVSKPDYREDPASALMHPLQQFALLGPTNV